jgi:hypothetical protein
MMFVCYSLTLGLLGVAYQWPDLCLLIVMAYAAWRSLR